MKNKLTPLLLPFSRTFGGMELSKRWWHRLAVVTYFMSLVTFACFVWLLRAEAPYRAGWTQPKWIHGGETTDAVGKRIGHSVYEASDKVVFFGPDGTLRLVQYNLVKRQSKAGVIARFQWSSMTVSLTFRIIALQKQQRPGPAW